MASADGFEILYNAPRNVLILRIARLLDVQSGKACERNFYGHIRKLSMHPQGWNFLLDLSSCPPQESEIQAILAAMLNAARKSGMAKHAVVVNRSLTPMSHHLSTSLPISFYFQSEEIALQWLAGES